MTRVGLAGAGWAGAVHAAALSAASGAHLAQVLSRTAEGADRVAGPAQVPGGTYAEISSKLGALIVATPAEHHRDMVLDAIGRGLAVLVEKPLALNLAECDKIIAAADAAGVVCGLAENLLFAPAVDVALAHRQTLGTLTRLSVRFLSDAPEWGHFLEPMPGGGVLHDLGAHPLALVVAFAGSEPTSVTAQVLHRRPDGVDDEVFATVTFASGLVAEIEVSWRASEIEWDLELAADDGVVRLEWFPEVTVECDGEDQTPAATRNDLDDSRLESFGYLAQTQGFIDVLAGRGGRVCPLGFGRLVQEITTAA